MKYLLDTHVALWAFGDRKKLSEVAKRAILDPENKKYVSIVSVWELAIKIRTGKLVFNGGTERFVSSIRDNGFGLLAIKVNHVMGVESLPLIHRDPFDRLLISTALVEQQTVISADENVHKYDVQWGW
jgi:PIN domain nuclease of toxin-antitoxin system